MELQAEFKRGDSYGASLIVPAKLNNDSGSGLNAGDLVERDGDGVKALTDGGSLLGVCHEDIANGETGIVDLPIFAVYKVTLASAGTYDSEGDAPDYGSVLTAAGSGEFDSTTTTLACGFIIDSDPASGDTCNAVLMCADMLNLGNA